MSVSPEIALLAGQLVAGERRAVARALNLIEDRRPEQRQAAAALLEALAAASAPAGHLVGITGPPGAGKSSLTSALIRHWRDAGRRVAVLAVDPSSPISGGALLGDRLRMLQPKPDDGVFIRSLAGRGECGGLNADVGPMSRVLLAAFDVVVVETVGVGQTEVDVAQHTDTTLLVVQPASGDTVQFLKSGIMEVPHVVVVNKADLGEPAERAQRELVMSLRRSLAEDDWQVPALLASAATGSGIEALARALEGHRTQLLTGGRLADLRADQEVAWGVKQLRNEFGVFGVELLGGEDTLKSRWRARNGSPFETLQRIREEVLETMQRRAGR